MHWSDINLYTLYIAWNSFELVLTEQCLPSTVLQAFFTCTVSLRIHDNLVSLGSLGSIYISKSFGSEVKVPGPKFKHLGRCAATFQSRSLDSKTQINFFSLSPSQWYPLKHFCCPSLSFLKIFSRVQEFQRRKKCSFDLNNCS